MPSSVEIVTEGLRGKTRWWRKAPLELANPQQQLLGNEHSIMLFAAGSAAKEQWFTVLRRAAGVDGGAGAAAEAMYVQFCESVRAGGMASCYPQVCQIEQCLHISPMCDWVMLFLEIAMQPSCAHTPLCTTGRDAHAALLTSA